MNDSRSYCGGGGDDWNKQGKGHHDAVQTRSHKLDLKGHPLIVMLVLVFFFISTASTRTTPTAIPRRRRRPTRLNAKQITWWISAEQKKEKGFCPHQLFSQKEKKGRKEKKTVSSLSHLFVPLLPSLPLCKRS